MTYICIRSFTSYFTNKKYNMNQEVSRSEYNGLRQAEKNNFSCIYLGGGGGFSDSEALKGFTAQINRPHAGK